MTRHLAPCFLGLQKVGFLAFGTAAVLACTSPANAPPREEVSQGPTLFAAYCADCHGPAGRGDGPRAVALVPPPPDLTRIAERNGGQFQADSVAARIDGRVVVRAHDPSEMPVWGRTLDDRNAALAEELKLTPALIAEIVAYLATLQEPSRSL
jgi:mono/diheme cytochrome c family protein